MKKFLIKSSVILCIILLIHSVCFSSLVNADGDIASTITTIGTGTGDAENGMSAIQLIIGAILNVIRIAGAAIAIVILLVIATKYIIASAGDRADIKKYAINYVIGALIFFGASAITTVIRDFFMDATS